MSEVKARKLIPVIMAISILVVAPCQAAKVYKWVDENGVMQFSTQPPLEQQKKQFEEVNIGNDSKNKASIYDFHWYMFDRGIKHTLVLSKDRYSLLKMGGSRNTHNFGKLIAEGKTLTVEYQSHEDNTKKGSKEIFYVAGVTDTRLVLVSDLTGKRYEYIKDSDAGGYNELTSSEENLLGNWKGIAGSDSIRFTDKQFIIRGRTRHGSGNFKYWARTERYRGKWSFDDPYLNLEVHDDLVHLKEDIPTKVGKQLKYQVLENSGDRLVLLSPDKRKKWTLLKVNR